MKFFFKNIILLSVLFFMLSLKSFTVINESRVMIEIHCDLHFCPQVICLASGNKFTDARKVSSRINIFNTMTNKFSQYDGVNDDSVIKYNG